MGLVATLVPTFASANTITVFDLTGTFENGATILPGSTVTLDVTLGVATASNIMISAGSNSPAETYTGVPNVDNGFPPFSDPLGWSSADNWTLTIFPPTPPSPPPDPSNPAAPGFKGFLGGPVGDVDYFDSMANQFSGGLTDSPLVFTPAVPEPASLSLLGLGLGLTAWRWRQRRRQCA